MAGYVGSTYLCSECDRPVEINWWEDDKEDLSPEFCPFCGNELQSDDGEESP